MKEHNLTNISEKDFKQVYEIIKEIGQQERHFNTLNVTYKTLASTWLLAVFGGIGFVLTHSGKHYA